MILILCIILNILKLAKTQQSHDLNVEKYELINFKLTKSDPWQALKPFFLGDFKAWIPFKVNKVASDPIPVIFTKKWQLKYILQNSTIREKK